MSDLLSGKTSMVTGSNRGIGKATIKVFAENGADVWACARTNSVEFEDYCKELSESCRTSVRPIYFDITDKDSVKSSIRKIGNKSGSIDVLVNNAGKSVEKLLVMTSINEIRETMEINYVSQVFISQIVSRYMIKQKSGSIINVASVAGIEREYGGIAYGSSKAAVIFSSKTMALELGEYGIRVNVVSPGFIATDMWLNRDEEIKNILIRETPLKRQGTPGEVANTILFLASELSSYISGQNIIVDGGRMGGVEKYKFKIID